MHPLYTGNTGTELHSAWAPDLGVVFGMGMHEAFALIQFVSERTGWVPLFAIHGLREETPGVGSGNFVAKAFHSCVHVAGFFSFLKTCTLPGWLPFSGAL